MRRELLQRLQEWKESKNRLPLILRGARQVGKTWLLKEFGSRYFDDCCYINFEREESNLIRTVFEGTISPQRIIDALGVYRGKAIDAQRTLILFDEIQEVPRALTALKYFAEEAPQYAICCAGSLLGVALHKGTSFPVGKVDFLDLQPLSFKEYLWANEEPLLVDYLSDKAEDPLVSAFSGKLNDYLKQYFIVGGMPAAVNEWLQTRDYYQVDSVHQKILATYDNDFSKHAPTTVVAKIRYVWDSISRQFAKENRKFIYGVVRQGGRARDYEDALLWLKDTGLIRYVYNVSKPGEPLKSYVDFSAFKLYVLDVGLLRSMSGLKPSVILEADSVFEEFKGALTEQYVLQQLSTLPQIDACYYWTSGATAEVDFLLSLSSGIYPLEVKSGKNVQAKSLKVYSEKYRPRLLLRTSLLPYSLNNRLLNIPLYSLFGIEQLVAKSIEKELNVE